MKAINIDNLSFGGRKLNSVVLVNEEKIDLLPSLFLFDRAIQSKAISSVRANAEDLCSFLNVVYSSSGNLQAQDITRRQMDVYIYSYLKSKRGLSQISIDRHCATLKAFYRWMYCAGFISTPKQFYFPKHRTPSRDSGSDVGSKYISLAGLKTLKENVLGETPFIRERNELILDLGYHCGFRAHEIVINFLNYRNVESALAEAQSRSEESFRVSIVGKGGKVRTIVVPPTVQIKIHKYLKRRKRLPEGPLICSQSGRQLNNQYPSLIFSDSLARMPFDKREMLGDKTYHCLRHSYATNLVTSCYENGRDPQMILPDLMGHESFSTTLKYIAWEAFLNNRVDVIERLSLKEHRHQSHG
ncbi:MULTISPECIES: tyrosine-type recombinase/integrase [Idiomarina]|uniref:tyrosine-type recombinase/integrase n=1 Tax=Idiomarina TaxID=135575 RepID=UPI000C6251D1|nr:MULTISPECIES: tyrosine-type recombinase/integrase [Idiomarina]MBP57991.1 hypothetical protein [Idiomarina sp.]|tara:strand:+ start:3247 stop:4317 length:1071 start_codon:yes stop_codon:yes gene_type:complete